jgi:hypothetical protein
LRTKVCTPASPSDRSSTALVSQADCRSDRPRLLALPRLVVRTATEQQSNRTTMASRPFSVEAGLALHQFFQASSKASDELMPRLVATASDLHAAVPEDLHAAVLGLALFLVVVVLVGLSGSKPKPAPEQPTPAALEQSARSCYIMSPSVADKAEARAAFKKQKDFSPAPVFSSATSTPTRPAAAAAAVASNGGSSGRKTPPPLRHQTIPRITSRNISQCRALSATSRSRASTARGTWRRKKTNKIQT